MTHNGHAHLPKLEYSERALVLGADCPRALLHVDRCPCGADTVRPYEPELIALMESEYGISERPDQRVRERVMAMTYLPSAEAVSA